MIVRQGGNCAVQHIGQFPGRLGIIAGVAQPVWQNNAGIAFVELGVVMAAAFYQLFRIDQANGGIFRCGGVVFFGVAQVYAGEASRALGFAEVRVQFADLGFAMALAWVVWVQPSQLVDAGPAPLLVGVGDSYVAGGAVDAQASEKAARHRLGR